jgi:hypothetical protein
LNAEEIVEDLEIDWKNGELGEIPLYIRIKIT